MAPDVSKFIRTIDSGAGWLVDDMYRGDNLCTKITFTGALSWMMVSFPLVANYRPSRLIMMFLSKYLGDNGFVMVIN